MHWPDWNNLSLASPQLLPWLLACAGAVVVLVFLFGRKHGRARWIAGGVRLLALAALGLVLLGPVVTVNSQTRFEPTGDWRLVLPGAKGPGHEVADVFAEPPGVFVNRVRDSLAGEHPPERTEVWGTTRDETLAVRDAVQALGVSCKPHFPKQEREAARPLLTGIEAPREVQPGEPLLAKFKQAGPPATLRAYLDGKPLALKDGKAEIRSEQPGRHVLESVLLDAQGHELQRTGQVFRVGDKPHALAIGLDKTELGRAQKLAPDMEFSSVDAAGFGGASLLEGGKEVQLALVSVDVLNQLTADQCYTLAGFVARGGGLFITGDGAKYVAPEYLSTDARNLLPVILQKEGKKPPPKNPPLEQELGKAEVAKVSICFVLDRSLSMNANIGNTSTTRWAVASKGVVDSIKLVEQGGKRNAKDKSSEAYATRVGVMAFTLKQDWVHKMGVVFPFDRDQIARELKLVGTELTQVTAKDFDNQGYNTDIYAAMQTAIDTMKKEKSAVKVIVMLTDGADRDQNTLKGKKHSDLRAEAIANDINIVSVGIGEQFNGAAPESKAARKVVTELATSGTSCYIASSPEDALKADVIFVDSVETAFQAYDDKKKREEQERKRRLEEQKKKQGEPSKVDVLPGTFPLKLGPVGAPLFGEDVLPKKSPKVAWLARNFARDGAAVALSAETKDPATTPVLAFQGYGLGRVGFWGAGTDPKALGELTGWADFPALFAASLRWLLPRNEPDVRLLAEATPDGVRILDPIDGAHYTLRRPGHDDISLTLKDGRLVAASPLPLGPAEVVERISDAKDGAQRGIGDVYVAAAPSVDSHQFAQDVGAVLPGLKARPPEVTANTREATLPVLYLLTLLLIVMPIERYIRRRS